MLSSIAHKYANALVEVAKETGSLESVLKQVSAFGEVLDHSDQLRKTLENPAIDFESKRGIVDAVASRMGLDKVTKNFILVVLENRRISKFPLFIEALTQVVDAARGVVRGKVHTPQPLDDSSRKRLEETLSQKTGKTVFLDVIEDPALIAGLKVQIGSVIYDGSVQTQLQRIHKQLTGL